MARNVIIVDDSKFLIKQISDFFKIKMGFTVIAEGADGNQAVELYKQYKPDLITLDITMPNRDGKDALVDILAFDPKARVVMISAVKGPAMLECMSKGAKGYIEKPLKLADQAFINDFITTINEIFDDAK
jgi:two-component system chemotaxis response regulator CheY